MDTLLSSLLSPNKHTISHELKRKIESADLLEIVLLSYALHEYYHVGQKLLDELRPQAHQLENLIESRLDQLQTY